MAILKLTTQVAFSMPEPKYIELDGSLATVYTGKDMPEIEKETPALVVDDTSARIILKSAGLLEAVEYIIKQHIDNNLLKKI